MSRDRTAGLPARKREAQGAAAERQAVDPVVVGRQPAGPRGHEPARRRGAHVGRVGELAAGCRVAVTEPYTQRRAGRELGSRSAVADSKQTLLCTYLSAVVLVGLGVNSLFGWSWADPLAALVIAVVAVKEGRDAWRVDTCCAVPINGSTPAMQRDSADACGCEPGCSCCSNETR